MLKKMFVVSAIWVMCVGVSAELLAVPGGNAAAGDVKWYSKNPNAAKFTISTAEQLAGLASIVNGTWGGTPKSDSFSGKTVTLTKDINLSKYGSWAPIGKFDFDMTDGKVTDRSAPFSGTFDGGGKTIRALANNQGLFGYIRGGAVVNLKLNGVNIRDGDMADCDYKTFAALAEAKIKAGGSPLPPPRRHPNQLDLTIIVSDSVIMLGAKGGFMPSIFYREFHRYITRDGKDTLVEYTPGQAPGNPATGRKFTARERFETHLYVVDDKSRAVIRGMHTKSGEMLTDANGHLIKEVKKGDTVFAHTNPDRRIIISNSREFVFKPQSVYDELMSRFIRLRGFFADADDADDIVIAAENNVSCGKYARITDIARSAGYSKIVFSTMSDGSEPVSDASVIGVVAGQTTGETVAASEIAGEDEIEAILSGQKKSGGWCDPDSKERCEVKVSSPDFLTNGVISGHRSRASVNRVVLQNMAALRHGYNKRLRDKPDLKGTITVKFAIDEFGRVIHAAMVSSTVNDPELETALLTRVRSWIFEKTDKPGDVTEVIYPFVYSQ